MFVDNSHRNSKLVPWQAAALFKSLATTPKVSRAFGLVNVSVVQSRLKLQEILASHEIKSLALTIQQDNGDQISSELRDSILEQMRRAKAQEGEVAFRAPSSGRLRITGDIRSLAETAAETGEVEAKIVVDGYTKTRNLSKFPVEITARFDPRFEDRFEGMMRAIRQAISQIKKK